MADRLVGRESQFEIAGVFLDGLVAGRGGVLLVTGEPGIGKSRFAEEIVVAAASRGVRVARVTSWQDPGAPPLWPWREVLRQLTGSTAALDQTAGESADAADASRFRQFELVARAVRGVTDTTPVAAALDDLQWADVASLRLFAFVASTLRDAPCLLVGACRPDELGVEEVAELARWGTTIALGGSIAKRCAWS
jgi:predicted ATPase